MFIGIKQDVIDLTRREKMQLREFFFGGMVQVDGRFVEDIQIGLQLFVIDFAKFGHGVVDIQYDFVEVWPNPSPSLKGRENE